MTKNGFKVMDSDMHIVEPPDLWQRYIDPAFKDRAPRGLTRRRGDVGIETGGKILPLPKRQASLVTEEQDKYLRESEDRHWDGVSQVMAMDKEGIDVAVLFPTRGLLALGMDGIDPALATAISRAYNNWLYDFCQAAPDRMYGAAMIPPHDVEGAVQEARRAVKELGFRGVFIRPNSVNGRNWHDPYYDPLWAGLERLGVPVCFHEGATVYLPQIGTNFNTHMMYHTCTHPMAMMLAVVDMIAGGVLERFPRLKVAFLEANCSWAPWLLWRLDEHYEQTGRLEHPELEMEPSEYFKRQCYVSVECDEEPARYVARLGYEDKVVFSTDYPHPDSKYPGSIQRFLSLPLSKRAKKKYLWDNCARLYGFA